MLLPLSSVTIKLPLVMKTKNDIEMSFYILDICYIILKNVVIRFIYNSANCI